MYESFTSPRCTGPAASAAPRRGSPSVTTTISPLSTPRSVSVAKRSARAKSARASVGLTASTARSSSLVSPVIGPSGVIAASICAMSMRSAPPMPRIERFTSSFATVEAVRRHVGRLHGRAGVDEHDDVAPLDERGRRARIAEREDQQRERARAAAAARAGASAARRGSSPPCRAGCAARAARTARRRRAGAASGCRARP